MPEIDYEDEYKAARRVPTFPQILARWQAASAADRATARTALDLAYGDGARQRYDVFFADAPARALAVFIHGGYWQTGDRQDYEFVARALNAAGVDVAFPSYSLCPGVTVLEIVDELRGFLAALWARTGRRPVVIGHSAGGHLTAALLATDWTTRPEVPADLVRAGCAISGVFELAPLLTTSLNVAARLDRDAAIAASPVRWPAPAGRTLVTAVGGDESAEFKRQSRTMADTWARAGVHTDYLEIPGAHHFAIVEQLADPTSALFRRVVSLTHH